MPKNKNSAFRDWDKSTLSDRHLAELRESAISEAIAHLNFQSLKGNAAIEAVAGSKLEKAGGHAQQYATKPVAKTIEKYQHCESGGWWCSGLDPLKKWGPMEWGCFKPDELRLDDDGDPIKYEHPPSEPTRVFFLRTEEPDYWEKVEGDRSIPLIITEGAKKAACGLSHGFATVAFPGVWQCTNKQTDGSHVLKDDLMQIVEGRLIFIAFDQDSKPKTQKAVRGATHRLGIALLEAGAESVKVINWNPQDGKGLDDLIAAHGKERFEQAIAKATLFKPDDPKYQGSRHESSVSEGLRWIEVTWPHNDDGVPEATVKTTRIGNHLKALAYAESPEFTGASLYLEFQDIQNRIRTITLPRAAIAGDGAETIRLFNDIGYSYNRKHRSRLLDYLNGLGAACKKRYIITPKTGWVADSFVTVDRTYGDSSLRYGQVEPPNTPKFAQSGDLESWKTHVAAPTVGNSRPTLAIGCALAAPLFHPLGVESGGIHFQGGSSVGKTTAANVAGSVYGSISSVVSQWRTTANGLEGAALEHNDLCLILDEIGQATPQDVGKAAYLLGNGQTKVRMSRSRKVDSAKTFRLLFLSTGEFSMTEYLSQANLSVKAGQEARVPSIPACPEKGHGVFEDVKELKAEEFIQRLEKAIATYYGSAFPAFMNSIIPALKQPEFKTALIQRHVDITKQLSQLGKGDEVIGRVAKRFALIQVALEIAIAAGIIPHDYQHVSTAVKTCFTDWIKARGGVGSIEVKQACERIRHLFVSNQMSDRIHIVGDNASVVRDLLAHRSGDELWVPTAVFDRELARDCNRKALIRELQDRGWLKPPTQGDRNTIKCKVSATRTANCFVFIFPIIENATGTTGTTGTGSQGKNSSGSRNQKHNGNQREPQQASLIENESESYSQQAIEAVPVFAKWLNPLHSNNFKDSVPVVPVGKNRTGTDETQSRQCRSRGSRKKSAKTQDPENDWEDIA